MFFYNKKIEIITIYELLSIIISILCSTDQSPPEKTMNSTDLSLLKELPGSSKSSSSKDDRFRIPPNTPATVTTHLVKSNFHDDCPLAPTNVPPWIKQYGSMFNNHNVGVSANDALRVRPHSVDGGIAKPLHAAVGAAQRYRADAASYQWVYGGTVRGLYYTSSAFPCVYYIGGTITPN